jgi:hypothetical protein
MPGLPAQPSRRVTDLKATITTSTLHGAFIDNLGYASHHTAPKKKTGLAGFFLKKKAERYMTP